MALFQTDNLWISQVTQSVAVLYLDVANRSVNVLSRQVLRDLDQAFDWVAKEKALELVILRSAKKDSFVAGADIRELAELPSPQAARELSEQGQRLFDKLAGLSIPTVAVISGPCLGGGLELALACDYRVLVNQPRTQLGFPEVELGLIPAWGGTQRLPRIVGLERGLQMILSGRRLRAREALAWALADALTDEISQEPPAFLDQAVKRPLDDLPLRDFRQKVVEGNFIGRWLVYRGTERLLRRVVPDDLPAPWEALEAVRVGLKQGIAAGLERERAAVERLAAGPASRNLLRVFLQREERRRLPEPQPEDEPPLRKVGVVGCGVMGAGIAQLAALHGCDVYIQEANQSALGLGILRIMALINRAVERGLIAPGELEKTMSRIHGSVSWNGFADLDLVIEAVVEDLTHKKAIFRELEKQVSPSTILATNTSSLRVAQLQEGLKHPGRVAGLHFFNPVHKMPLVEVVRSHMTRDRVTTALQRFVVALGKTPIVVKDSPGFVVNRVLAPYFNEAVLLASAGMRIELIDQAMERFGMPAGPLELLDQIGLDVAQQAAHNLQEVIGERLPRTPAFEVFRQRGWLGQKSGAGFYRYRSGRKHPHRAAQLLLEQLGKSSGVPALEPASPAEYMKLARERLVGLMINEAAQCLAEGIVKDAETLDLALVLGAGWAPHRGGPLTYARQQGLGQISARLEELARQHGPRYEPCPALRNVYREPI